MSRLPTPGQDAGAWGTILNDFLSQSHASDGSLKPIAATTLQAIPQNKITNLETDLAAKANNADIPTTVANTIKLQHQAAGIFSIIDFGAKGDGTTDDSTAIQAAVTAAQQVGGLVWIPAGEFLITSLTPTITGSCSIDGAGRGSILRLAEGANANCLQIGSGVAGSAPVTYDVTVSNVALIGNCRDEEYGQPLVDYTERIGIYIHNAENVTVFNCYATNTYGPGIEADTSKVIRIIGNHVEHCHDNLIFIRTDNVITDGCSDIIIANNTADWSDWYPISALFSDHIVITGNIATRGGQFDPSQGCGLDIESCRYVTISDNIARDNLGGGIHVRFEDEGYEQRRNENVSITGNSLFNNINTTNFDEANILVDSADGLAITGNTLKGSRHGIRLGDVQRVLVSSNSIEGHAALGINIQNPSAKDVVITGNQVLQNSGGILTYVSRTVIADNLIAKNNNQGVSIMTGAKNSLIKGNIIRDNGDNGVLVDSTNTDGVEIFENFFDNEIGVTYQSRAIYVSSGGGPVRIYRNRARNMNWYEVEIASVVPGTLLYDNDFTSTIQPVHDHAFGTATIASGATSITVNHGVYTTPGKVIATPVKSLGSATSWWIDTITATQFTIHLNATPGASVDFNWEARTVA